MTAQTDSNVIERLKRAVYPSDPTLPDGDWIIRTAAAGGGTSTTDNTNYTPGSSSLTPAGGYYGGRQVGSGHIAAVAINGSAMLQVEDSTIVPITMTQTVQNVGSGNTVILNSNAARKYFLIINDSDSVIYLSTNGAASIGYGVRLDASGGAYEMPDGKVIPTGTISAVVSAAATKNLLVSEGT